MVYNFTQIVWKETEYFGVGRATMIDKDGFVKTIIVANYLDVDGGKDRYKFTHDVRGPGLMKRAYICFHEINLFLQLK